MLSYCQIWTDLGKILHTPIVVQNGADLDRDRRVGGSRPNQNDCFFCNTCNALYLYRDDRSAANRQSGGEDRCYRKKILEFCTVGGARSKTAFFSFLRVPFDYLAHSLQETVLRQPMVPMKSRDSKGVPFDSLDSL